MDKKFLSSFMSALIGCVLARIIFFLTKKIFHAIKRKYSTAA